MGHREHGFTLIELVAALGLSGLLLLALSTTGSWVSTRLGEGRTSQERHDVAWALAILSRTADEICVIESLDATQVRYLDQAGRHRRLSMGESNVSLGEHVLGIRLRMDPEVPVPANRQDVTPDERDHLRMLTIEIFKQVTGEAGDVILRTTRLVRVRPRPHPGDIL